MTLQVFRIDLNLGGFAFPEAVIVIVVVSWAYPPPPWIMFTELMEPLTTLGVITAPTPSPKTSIIGVELYPLPEFCTMTWTILPFSIIGFNWQLEPALIVTWGCWSRFKISDEPYPIPPFSRWTEETDPLKIGNNDASKVSDPIEEIPISPFKVTVISG